MSEDSIPLELATLDQISDELKRRYKAFALSVERRGEFGDGPESIRVWASHSGGLTALGLAKMHCDDLSEQYRFHGGRDSDDDGEEWKGGK